MTHARTYAHTYARTHSPGSYIDRPTCHIFTRACNMHTHPHTRARAHARRRLICTCICICALTHASPHPCNACMRIQGTCMHACVRTHDARSARKHARTRSACTLERTSMSADTRHTDRQRRFRCRLLDRQKVCRTLVFVSIVRIHACVFMHVCSCMCVHAYTRTHVHTCMHTCG